MSYEMNFEMYVGKKEQRADVLRVAKNALITKGYEEFADNLVADKRDRYMIKEDTSMTYLGENFDDAISTIYQAIVKELPEVVFKGFSGYTDYTYEAGHCFEKQDNTLIVGKIGYEGEGFCLECGETVVDVDDFDPAKTYTCPECGEVIPNEELFSQYDSEDITYEIVDGKLIVKDTVRKAYECQ